WSANFTQGYESQTNNSLPTEWPMNLTQDQTNISLPNVYNNSSLESSAGLSQDQINNNLPIAIEWPTDFTNNNPFTERNANFTQYHTITNTSLPNIYNNPTIESFAGITRNDGDQTNHKLPIACLTEDQNNICLPKIYNAGVTKHCEEQINTLQHYNAKSVKKNKHSVSPVSRHEGNTKFRCQACLSNKKRYPHDKNSNLCKDCYQASSRNLSGNKLIDDFIKFAQTFST
ncbi:15860_t:CDS:1, partial [Gigaspora margarita]